jgi:hypothetical protein
MRKTFSRRQFLARSVTAAIAASTATFPRIAKAEASRLQTRVLGAKASFVEQSFLRPLIISSGTISKITEAVVEVSVRVNGIEATGRGSMYLSDLWAWPDPALTHADRDSRLRELVEEFARRLDSLCGGEAAHPLELGLRLHESVCREKSPPVLARAMCASPFDAAIHDAAGIGLGMSAFDFCREPTPIPTADRHFRGGSAVAAIAKILRTPKRELRAWYVVGKNDSMEAVVGPWIRDRGYHCFKIKLLGKDNAYDVGRTVEVYREARRLGAQKIQLDVDTNEANPDAASVIDYFERLRAADADAYEALLYFEQPTGRDITVHKFDWRTVTRFKPVMLDEGLTRPAKATALR